MQEYDKSGNRIYPHLFRRLQQYGRMLERFGYKEAVRSPNLFYCTHGPVVFFADMRGTEIAPIWESRCPNLYWKWSVKTIPFQERLRIVGLEVVRLDGIPLNISDDMPCVDQEGYGRFAISAHYEQRVRDGKWTKENLSDLFRTIYLDYDNLGDDEGV